MLEHGGNLQEAIVRFGRPRETWLDLSTGINPFGYPAPALSAEAWHRLPETDPALIRAAQDYYSAPCVLPMAGTQAAIQALPRLRAQDGTVASVVVAAPTYAEHAHGWNSAGHAVREISYPQLDDVIAECDVMVVCNPNNPTGATIAPHRLLAWADRLAQRGGWLVVDEAFGDTVPELSVAAHTGQHGLIVLRSLGKFFGLAGVRLGFVAAHPTLLAALADILGPWTVSGPAQEIGRVALQDRSWQAAMRSHLAAEGERLNQLLRRRGLQASGSALYQWCPQDNVADATRLWNHMAQHGIWVRLFRSAACGVRFGLPPNESGWQRLSQALSTYDPLVSLGDQTLEGFS
ncbi:MAG: threonine-phosphate decarboxylase CobD [Pseudomonadota bacterium]